MSRIIIDSNNKKNYLNIRELFSYKDLLLTLTYRDFKIRYTNTSLGFLWAFIQPASTLLILTLVFQKAVKIEVGNIPYTLYALSGLVIWTYFSYLMSQAGSSIVNAQHMVKKIYFPRLVIPLSKGLVGLIDLMITFLLLIIFILVYKYPVSINILYFPVIFIALLISSLGVGIWLSALTTRFRDFQFIIPFMTQLGLYATPVAYPASFIPSQYLFFYYLNPMAGIIEIFRWSLFGTNIQTPYCLLSIGMGIILFISSLFYFKKVESVIADIV